jgi:hypothetical protein
MHGAVRMMGWVVGAAVALGMTTAATAAPQITFEDGIHQVGADIPPGTYRSEGVDGCYWARLAGFSGELDDIIANGNASDPIVVTIKRRDKGFESSGCGTWTSNLSRITRSKIRFGDGIYIVKTDIRPGTYRSTGSDCYWARLRSFDGELGSIIANGNTSGRAIVTIKKTDRGFESSRCGTWARIGG